MPQTGLYNSRTSTNLDEDDLLKWEDSDNYSVPPPNLRNATDDDAPMPVSPASPRNSLDRMADVMRRQTQHASSQPKQSEFQPNKWQRLAAGAAGFGAGFVNAGGRVRVDPQATRNITGSLMSPGYGKAQQKWEEDSRPLQAEAAQVGREYQIEAAREKAAIDADRARAYVSAQGSSKALNERRAQALDEDPWVVSSTGRTAIKKKSGEVKQIEAPKDPGPVKETPASAIERRAKEVSTSTLTPEQKEVYRLTGKVPASKQPKVGKGGGEKRGTPGQFNSVRTRKTSALKKLEDGFNKAIKAHQDTYPEGESEHASRVKWMEAKQAIVDAHEAAKQDVLADFDEGVVTLGGDVPERGGQSDPAGVRPSGKKDKKNDPLGIR